MNDARPPQSPLADAAPLQTQPVTLSRRGFLTTLAATSAAGTHPGIASARTDPGPDVATYKPAFFEAAEWAFVRAATARLIPSDGDGPGAIEAGVPI